MADVVLGPLDLTSRPRQLHLSSFCGATAAGVHFVKVLTGLYEARGSDAPRRHVPSPAEEREVVLPATYRQCSRTSNLFDGCSSLEAPTSRAGPAPAGELELVAKLQIGVGALFHHRQLSPGAAQAAGTPHAFLGIGRSSCSTWWAGRSDQPLSRDSSISACARHARLGKTEFVIKPETASITWAIGRAAGVRPDVEG
jgi:hypothetical protein